VERDTPVICPSEACQVWTIAGIVCLALSWGMWFPFAFQEHKMPLWAGLIALVVAVTGAAIIALRLPYVYTTCGGAPWP
jgi:hypothetical protein